MNLRIPAPGHRLLLASALALSATALAHSASAQQTCEAKVPSVERQLRQLYLDLLGRPPTIAEYRAQQGKGRIEEEDIRALLGREEFYGRMKAYHRALLRANVAASLPSNGDTRLATSGDGAKPLETRGNISTGLRGRNGIGCDHFIPQDDCKNPAHQQDPHAEGAAAQKICRDAHGVPMPVSFDYDTALYACTPLAPAVSCQDAVSKGLLEDRHLLFCDMRRTGAALAPFRCLPDKSKPTPAALTDELLDAQGRVTAFVNPRPAAGAAFDRLERCTLTLGRRNGVVGTYATQRGCIQREGHVMADAPFWVGGSVQVASCAIEAQARDVNPATMSSCERRDFLSDRSCGCGQNFRRCESGDREVYEARVAAISEEPVLIADSVLRRDEPYFQMLTTRRGFVNGTLSALYRQNQAIGVLAITPPLARDAVPERPFSSEEWVEYLRDDNASGVLTTPGWLYRFPTDRSRVAQFYEAFLCKSFVPPADAVAPDPEHSCNRENNLAKRCGCNYCHATIEPAGAHWGRYGERNALYLDPARFPRFDAKCRDCALSGNTNCDGECGDYVMQAYDGDGASSLGMLKSYLYRTADDEANILGGPRLLVERTLQTGDLERCTVKRVWSEFIGRPMAAQEQELYLERLVASFVDSRHNLKQLVLRVVTTDAYRRID